MEKLEKYKRTIDKMLNSNVENGFETVKQFVINDYNKKKISRDEYLELARYARELKNMKEQQKEEIERKIDKYKRDTCKFREKLDLKYIPIYKGEFRKIAPSRGENSKGVDR